MVREASVLLGNLRSKRDQQLSTVGGVLVGFGGSAVVSLIDGPDRNLSLIVVAVVTTAIGAAMLGKYLRIFN